MGLQLVYSELQFLLQNRKYAQQFNVRSKLRDGCLARQASRNNGCPVFMFAVLNSDLCSSVKSRKTHFGTSATGAPCIPDNLYRNTV